MTYLTQPHEVVERPTLRVKRSRSRFGVILKGSKRFRRIHVSPTKSMKANITAAIAWIFFKGKKLFLNDFPGKTAYVFPSGQYAGKTLSDVPPGYLAFVLKNKPKWAKNDLERIAQFSQAKR